MRIRVKGPDGTDFAGGVYRRVPVGNRFVGIDVGAETVKVIELHRRGSALEPGRRILMDHRKDPQGTVLQCLDGFEWSSVAGAAITGRLSRILNLPQIPVRAAQTAALDFLHRDSFPLMLISIGSRGFSVLEIRPGGQTVFRENSRCSQGTGNFLRQLSDRFGLTVEEASLMASGVQDPASLSGRCPVILKTDMTHLANQGEPRERILAGLFDALCENVQSLIKPRTAPRLVWLAGGVSRSPRVRQHFRRFLEKHGIVLADHDAEEAIYLEAIGAAVESARIALPAPDLADLPASIAPVRFEEAPELRRALPRLHRMTPRLSSLDGKTRRLILGFDIGSTGSKLVALDVETVEPVWEAYRSTRGDPVGAAQDLAERFVRGAGGTHEVLGFGVTGSGREIVGSLLASCYGVKSVLVLNEIAAHATGALHYDRRVDTIFEIGGQDAKYIRLSAGQVCDAAMNEACSAGTGSFIEEQGRKLNGVGDAIEMAELALTAERCVSLGQHCSVFMAEIIDAAVSAGRPLSEVAAGVYDSVVQNYLNRVKGNRSVGRRIFCQGMPFSSDALAAALAARTGCDVTIPPNPGTVGALGIALLAAREPDAAVRQPLDPGLFLSARVVNRDVFICRSAVGCGGSGNKCRIERLTAEVGLERRRFHWGGGCSLYDRGMGRKKLPDGTPDPFRERERLVQDIVERCGGIRPGRPTVALTDEFALKNLFPFFAVYLHGLGMNLRVITGADRRVLKRGIEEFNVPYCAPLQLYCGLAGELCDTRPDYLLLPMLRDIPKAGDEPVSVACSLAQASPDIISLNSRNGKGIRILKPMLDMGEGGLESKTFRDCCRRLALMVGAANAWKAPLQQALAVQSEFQSRLKEIGEKAIGFAARNHVTPVVVLGRSYTIYNNVLNSNVPNLLRELGALPIPVDCYAIDGGVPVFHDIYWGYSQLNLRAAHQIRRTEGIYSVFCSNYSCGPDSFNLHFFSHLMEHKPFAVIETDGHSGDAGTKTRLEAFLYCVDSDRRAAENSTVQPMNILHDLEKDRTGLADVPGTGRLLLIPRMGPTSDVLAAVLRGEGMRAESLPVPDREAIRIGRSHTSGKECLPLTVTLGSALKRVFEGPAGEKYAFLMAGGRGPCRFGMYSYFNKLSFKRLGLQDRIRVVSPPEENYFLGFSQGFALKVWAAAVAVSLLEGMLHEVRPAERSKGAAESLYHRYLEAMMALLERTPAPSFLQATAEIPGRIFGLRSLLTDAGRAFHAAADPAKSVPTVAVTGEIYVRCDPGSNDSLIEKLEEHGLRARLAPIHEYLEYVDWWNERCRTNGRRRSPGGRLAARLSIFLKHTVMRHLCSAAGSISGPLPCFRIARTIRAAAPYLNPDHEGEAILTLGGPILMHQKGEIAGIVCAAPLECLPTKVAESQLFHVSENTGLLNVAVYFNGDPLDAAALDNFAYEVKARHTGAGVRPVLQRPGTATGKPDLWNAPRKSQSEEVSASI